MIEYTDPDLLDSIRRHEGLRLTPYQCPAGYLTIGYGRNLEANGLSLAEAEMLLSSDVRKALEAAQAYSYFPELSDARQRVLVEMAFQLGAGTLSLFHRMHRALRAHDYETAADEMLDSRWARQTPRRALALSNRMRVNGPDGHRAARTHPDTESGS